MSRTFRAGKRSNADLTDGVPTMVPETLGYHHQYVWFSCVAAGQTARSPTLSSAREYWQFEEPGKPSSSSGTWIPYLPCLYQIANLSTIRRCEGQEDPECSRSVRKSFLCCAAGLELRWCQTGFRFRSINRNQYGARNLFWTGYVQHLGEFYPLLMRIFYSHVVISMDATLCL
jgi:hypothetical protein